MKKSDVKRIYETLLSFYGDHSRIPIDVFSAQLKMNIDEAQLLLDSLHAVKEEKRLPTRLPLAQVLQKSAPVKKKGRPPKKIENTGEGGYSVPFLKILALPFAIGALILSAYFSIDFLSKQFHWVLATALSITIIGFGSVCFECLTLFAKRKAWGWAILFGVMWIGITTYSVGTSVSSLYETYLNRVYEKQVTFTETNANRALLQSYRDEEAEKINLMNDKRARLTIQQGILKELNTIEKQKENKAAYGNAYWAASQLEKEISNISTRISELRLLQQNLLKADSGIASDGVAENRPDIYTWLARIFGVNEDKMQFILQVIPAMALDAISPLALYLFLFLRKKETI